jgi:hypothetical protein
MLPLILVVGLCTTSHAQDVDSTPAKPAPAPPLAKKEAPKPSTPMDRFDMKTIDTGRQVQQRLELDVPNSKDTFIFGNKTTTYPGARNPGQIYQPPVPQQQTPQDRYSIGIGKRF